MGLEALNMETSSSVETSWDTGFNCNFCMHSIHVGAMFGDKRESSFAKTDCPSCNIHPWWLLISLQKLTTSDDIRNSSSTEIVLPLGRPAGLENVYHTIDCRQPRNRPISVWHNDSPFYPRSNVEQQLLDSARSIRIGVIRAFRDSCSPALRLGSQQRVVRCWFGVKALLLWARTKGWIRRAVINSRSAVWRSTTRKFS